MLPKTIAHVKSYDGQTKWMYFLIERDGLLEKLWNYNTNRNNMYENSFVKVYWILHDFEVE